MLATLKTLFKGKQASTHDVFHGRYLKRLPVERLLQSYQEQLDEIKVLTGVPDKHFDYLYLTPLKTYVEFMQLAPASESHHHSSHGGMIEHTLEVVVNALRLRRGQILPTGVPPEEIEHRKDIWTFVVFICALLHDAGKLISDLELENEQGQKWNLLSSCPPPMIYRVTYNANRRHKFHEKLAPFAVYKIFGQGHIDWIMTDNEAWYALVNFLTADYAEASVIAEIIQKADQASVIANLGGNVNDAIKRPVQALSLPERLLKSLQQLLEENAIGINKQGAIGYVDADYAYFTVKPLLDKVKEKMRDQGLSVPASNNTLMGELQQSNIVESNGDKATFRVRVNVGNWQQDFSVLKLRVIKVWPDKRPARNDTVSVVELSEDGEPITVEKSTHEAKPTDTKVTTTSPLISTQTDSKDLPRQQDVAERKAVIKKVAPKPGLKTESNVNEKNIKQPQEHELPDFSELDEVMGLDAQPAKDALDDFDMALDTEDDVDIEAWSPAMIENESIEANVTNVATSKTIKQPDKLTVNPAEEVEERQTIIDEVKVQITEGPKNFISRYNEEALNTEIKFTDLDDPGAQFIGWLKSGLKTGAIPINIPGGPAHFVKEGLFLVSPQIFRTFQTETGIGWSQAQRSITKSSRKINLKTSKGENMFTYEILSKTGRTKDISSIKGILIPRPSEKLGLTLDDKNENMIIIE